MQKISKVLALSALVLSLGLAGCGKKNVKSDEDHGDQVVDSADVNSGVATSDSENAMGLQTIHFPYNSFDVVGENKDILNSNVKIMKENAGLKVQIEGHCDERGGIQYNLALGEKRANAIKRAMTNSGIEKSRITTISMGKEKPIAQGTGEEVWAKNRRGNFVITEK